MLKSMAPNLFKDVFYRDNRHYGVKTGVQLSLGALWFESALLWIVSTFK